MSDDLKRRHMVLTMFMHPAGYHNYSWRGPESRAEEWGELGLIVDLARQAEAAKLDAVFFADTVSAAPMLRGDTKVGGYYEPITALSALASVTSNIGLIGTGSTTFNHPTALARQFAGLDTLSGGRAGWNIVTSFLGNEQFGMEEMPDAADRYRHAHEFVDVARRLWHSWEEDAVIADRETSWWIDPAKVHAIDHVGEQYRVQGPLNMRRSPQGGPLLVQAGSSGPGIDLGATYADLIYTAQPMLDSAVEFYSKYKDVVESKGRARDEVAILPGILPIIGRTDAEAKEFLDELTSLIDLDHGRAQLAFSLGFSVDDLDWDESIPAERFDTASGTTSRREIFRRRSVEQGYTLRDLIIESARASGHLWTVGSASKIADQMADWFASRACDGFSLNAPSIPEGYRRICDLLVPELQERGLFHEDYTGGTLRQSIDAGRQQPVGV